MLLFLRLSLGELDEDDPVGEGGGQEGGDQGAVHPEIGHKAIGGSGCGGESPSVA